MSCVVAIQNNEKVVIMADSCLTNYITAKEGKIKKIFQLNPETVVGVCGSVRDLNLIETYLSADYSKGYTKKRILVELIPKIQDILSQGGSISINEAQVAEIQSTILIASTKGLFVIQGDFGVVEYSKNYLSIGAGSDIAETVLSTIELLEEQEMVKKLSLKDKATLALTEVSKITVGVAPPFNIIILTKPTTCKKCGGRRE